MNTRRSRVGLTLIELLVVIVIIGILAAILIPAIRDAVQMSREKAKAVLGYPLPSTELTEGVIVRVAGLGEGEDTSYAFLQIFSAKPTLDPRVYEFGKGDCQLKVGGLYKTKQQFISFSPENDGGYQFKIVLVPWGP